MNASDFISKAVIDINSAEMLGTVKTLYFSETLRRIEAIIAFNDDTETDISIDPKYIHSVGSSAVMVKNFGLLMFENFTQGRNNPLGAFAYSLEGELLGMVTEIELTEKYMTRKVFVEATAYDASQIMGVNQGTVLVNNSGKKLVRKKTMPKQKTKKEGHQVTIMPIELPPKIEVPQNYDKPYVVDSSPSPQRIITNQSFLVGRKASKTIYGINNEIIARKDANITQKIIENATLHSKLNELAVFSAKK